MYWQPSKYERRTVKLIQGKEKMKLYQFDAAPSSKRVEKFLKETNIQVETVQLNIMEGQHFKEPFKTMTPLTAFHFQNQMTEQLFLRPQQFATTWSK